MRLARRGGGWLVGGGTVAALLVAWVLAFSVFDVFDTDRTPSRFTDGTGDLDLSVTGRPSPGTLSTAEHVIARLKARDADGLAALALPGDGTKADAERWVKKWGKAAQQPVTLEFLEGGAKQYVVTARFRGVAEELDLILEWDTEVHEDTYGILLLKVD
ncbi:hypothetical protein ACIO3O_10375 [Streptomyces sp. NPDC087440]|uniref:hypothetical protein n=1 Tax=Streptomyces sp. NPDC087440 TaxID=3365790 RepID=UPI0038080E51